MLGEAPMDFIGVEDASGLAVGSEGLVVSGEVVGAGAVFGEFFGATLGCVVVELWEVLEVSEVGLGKGWEVSEVGLGKGWEVSEVGLGEGWEVSEVGVGEGCGVSEVGGD
jgi:hypothetical protein